MRVVSKNIIALGFSLIVFRLFLDFSYIKFVVPVFAYQDFEVSFKLLKYILSWLIYFSMILITPSKTRNVSDFIQVCFTLWIIAPLSSMYGLTEKSLFPVVTALLSIWVINIVVKVKVRPFSFGRTIKNGGRKALLLSLFMILYLIIWYMYSGAFRFFNINLSEVYNSRAQVSQIANVGILTYLNLWVMQVFAPFFLTWFLYKRKYLYIFLILALQLFFFGVSSHKSILFYPFFIIGVWFYFRKTISNTPFVYAHVGLILIVIVPFLIIRKDILLLPSMFIRRLFYVPADLTFQYFDFFSENPYIFWSNSILDSFLDYPYSKSLPKVIGDYVGTGVSANNGYISSGYAHAGVIGVLIYTIIIAILIRIMNVMKKFNLPVWVTISIVIIPTRNAIVNSDLFTTMLTHGLILSMLLLLLIRSKQTALR